jgi:hypothetical protein
MYLFGGIMMKPIAVDFLHNGCADFAPCTNQADAKSALYKNALLIMLDKNVIKRILETISSGGPATAVFFSKKITKNCKERRKNKSKINIQKSKNIFGG